MDIPPSDMPFGIPPRVRVYTASKLAMADRWKNLIVEWPEVEFTARWVTHHVGRTPDHACFARIFWEHDHEDVARADLVMLYGGPGEHLRGGLVEAGMAIGMNKPVIVVGDHPDYGTWQYHPNVHRVPDLEHARNLLYTMSMTLETVRAPGWEDHL